MTAVTIPKPKLVTVIIPIIGTTPLICHAWDEKIKGEMLAKQMKKAVKTKQTKDPEASFKASLYKHPDGGYGFPSTSFKSAAVRAAKLAGVPMTDAKQMFFIKGELTKIIGTPTMREDMVRLKGNTADIRHRGEFKEWSADLEVQYNEDWISAEQIANLISLAGFSVGVGEWRPEKNGQYGTFAIA